MAPTVSRLMIASLFFAIVPMPLGLHAAPVPSEQVFHNLVQARLEAVGRGDVDAYVALLDRDFVHVADTGKRRNRSDLSDMVHSLSSPDVSYRVRDVHWKLAGGLALIDCEVVEHRGGIDLYWRETDIFKPSGGRWLFLLHQETAVLQPPESVAVAPTTLDDYVGRYRYSTGQIDMIVRKGNVLVLRERPEDEGTELIPVARDAFVIPGDATFSYFSRDRDGRVTSEVVRHLTGKIVVGERIE